VVLATPVDPLLVLLPLLRPTPAVAPAMFEEIDALLTDPRWPGLAHLRTAVEPLLPLICDVKDVEEEEGEEEGVPSTRRRYYRVCDRRAAAYLRLKARRAAQALRDSRSPAAAQLDDAQLLEYAQAWLGEWTGKAWVVGGGERGREREGDDGGLLQIAALDGKQRADGVAGFEEQGFTDVTPEAKAAAAKAKGDATRQANKAAKMASAAAGARSIMSFFGKKK
jgi:hypothetical protein